MQVSAGMINYNYNYNYGRSLREAINSALKHTPHR
jgi:hypothetical protein